MPTIAKQDLGYSHVSLKDLKHPACWYEWEALVQVTNPPPGQTLPAGQSRALDGGASGVQRNPSTGAVERQAPVPQVTRPAGGPPQPSSFSYRGAKGGVATAAVSHDL